MTVECQIIRLCFTDKEKRISEAQKKKKRKKKLNDANKSRTINAQKIKSDLFLYIHFF